MRNIKCLVMEKKHLVRKFRKKSQSGFQKSELRSQGKNSIWKHIQKMNDERFRYSNAHENNTLLDLSKLVCTKDDLVKLTHLVNKTDVIESCTREKMITKRRSEADKLNCICCFTPGRTYGLQVRCFTRASSEKLHSQLSHI